MEFVTGLGSRLWDKLSAGMPHVNELSARSECQHCYKDEIH